MFKMTRHDRQTQSDAQLRALFQQASQELATAPRLGAAFDQASQALLLIRCEMIRRGLRIG